MYHDEFSVEKEIFPCHFADLDNVFDILIPYLGYGQSRNRFAHGAVVDGKVLKIELKIHPADGLLIHGLVFGIGRKTNGSERRIHLQPGTHRVALNAAEG